MILLSDGDPTLQVPMGLDVPYPKELTGFTDVKLRLPKGYGMETAKTLHRLNLNKGVIGLVGIDEMSTSINAGGGHDKLIKIKKRLCVVPVGLLKLLQLSARGRQQLVPVLGYD